MTPDRALHAVSHSEPVRVLGASLASLAVSYSGLMDGLRLLSLVLSIVYVAIKIAQSLKPRDSDSDHPDPEDR